MNELLEKINETFDNCINTRVIYNEYSKEILTH